VSMHEPYPEGTTRKLVYMNFVFSFGQLCFFSGTFTNNCASPLWNKYKQKNSPATHNIRTRTRKGNYLGVKEALASGAQSNCTDKQGQTPLISIAKFKELEPKTRMEIWKPLSFEHLEIARLDAHMHA
jgi:hypothetical protein